MQNRGTTDNGERYPAPVAAFDVWFAARCREAATAKTESAIDAPVQAVAAYTNAQWCYPHRLTTITGIAKKRWGELNRTKPSRKDMATGGYDAATGEVR